MEEDSVGHNGPIIDELLCFIVNKMSILDDDSMIRLCDETYDDEECQKSKDLVFGLLHNADDSTSLIKRRQSKISDSKKVKLLKDILQLLQEKGTTQLPKFVALDLGKLPPITFDHIDVSALLSQINRVKTKTDALQIALRNQAEVSSALADNDNILKDRVQGLEKVIEKYYDAETEPLTREPITTYRCKYCEVKLVGLEEVEEHMSNHSGDLIHPGDLDSTGSKSHTEACISLPYSCTECGLSLATDAERETHINVTHRDLDSPGQKPQEEAKNKSASHTETPKSLPFACTECDLYFATKEGRVTHFNGTHRVIHKCNKCNYSCGRQDNLIRHMKTHENIDSKFSCSVCDYECTSQELYRVHMLIHNAESNNKHKPRPRTSSFRRKDSVPSTNAWEKLSLDDLARKHFLDSIANNEGFSAPCRNGKPMKEKDLRKTTNPVNSNKQSRKPGVVGTAKGSNLTVNENERKYRGTVFATRYRSNTEIAEVKSNLERNLCTATGVVHNVDVERLKPRFDTYSSFKITCVCNNTSVLMNPEIWPERSFVRWWRDPPKSNGGVNGSSKN